MITANNNLSVVCCVKWQWLNRESLMTGVFCC